MRSTHPGSQEFFPNVAFETVSNVGRIDHEGPFLVLSRKSVERLLFLRLSLLLLQAIDGVIVFGFVPAGSVSQAPQHLRSSETLGRL